MKSLIVYGCFSKLTNAHKRVTNPKAGQPFYYVRVKVVAGDCSEALGHAKPMTGETVLNTIDIP